MIFKVPPYLLDAGAADVAGTLAAGVVLAGLVAEVSGAVVVVVVVAAVVVGALLVTGLVVVGEAELQPVMIKARVSKTTTGVNNLFNVSSYLIFFGYPNQLTADFIF